MEISIWYDGADRRSYIADQVPRVGDRITYPPDAAIPEGDCEEPHSLIVARVIWRPFGDTPAVWLYCEWAGTESDDMDGMDWHDD